MIRGWSCDKKGARLLGSVCTELCPRSQNQLLSSITILKDRKVSRRKLDADVRKVFLNSWVWAPQDSESGPKPHANANSH